MREGEPCGGSGAWRAVGCSAGHDHEIGRASSIRASTASRALRTWTYVPSTFECGIAAETRVGPHPAVSVTIAGQAWFTGIFQYGVDPSDSFRDGYTLPDLWVP